MNYTIKDNHMEVVVSTSGAEMHSIKDKNLNHEYLWQGKEEFWGFRAPILFPIVSALKIKNTYLMVKNTPYLITE